MNIRVAFLLLLRLLFTAMVLFTSFYCFLAFPEFTFHQIHKGGLIPALNQFAVYHPFIHLGGTLPLVVVFFEYFRRARQNPFAVVLASLTIALQAGTGLCLIFKPLLIHLKNDETSLIAGFVVLIPMICLALTDFVAGSSRIEWTDETTGHSGSDQPPAAPGFTSVMAACCAAFFVSLVYAVVVQLRRGVWIQSLDGLLPFAGSLLTHAALFLLILLFLEWLSAISGVFNRSQWTEFWLVDLSLGAVVTLFFLLIVAPAVGLSDWPSWAVSLSLGLCLSLFHAGLAVWLATTGRVVNAPANGLGLLLTPLRLGISSPPVSLFALLFAGVLLGLISVKAAAMDWNNLLQMTAAALLWATGFALCNSLLLRRSSRPGSRPSLAGAIIIFLLLGGYKALESASFRDHANLEAWASYDPSLTLAKRILDSAPKKLDSTFYRFLSRNTNIPASVHIEPLDLNFVDHLAPSGVKRPHIFLFTIDSLRRDYLSPYNRSVTFTPSIDRFARESTVFENAFTRYGGTGLSEPSIWMGAAMLHKQYIAPFAPMNTLEKLLHAEGYQLFLSPDSILTSILQPSRQTVPIDPAGATMELDFVDTLTRLTEQLRVRPPGAPPVFAYTQPQNIHISVINRSGAAALNGESYPGYYAPYASRLKRMDDAFGQFIAALKALGLYDDSVIILTADHGDSLGEEGRWGHAYTIFPEVIRIPLVVHLPKWISANLTTNEKRLVFTTDISPTLYYLLGHAPTLQSELIGAPLFTKTAAEQLDRRKGRYLIASSYAPVYGILSKNGTEFFIEDAVNYKDYLFELRGNTQEQRSVSDDSREQNQALIRSAITSVNQFYRLPTPTDKP